MIGRSMEAPRFFEGPEKKLELIATPEFGSLRQLGEGVWRKVVEAAGASILSTLRNEHCDAYLLSESSLFVYDDWFAMITCGQTTLVDAFEEVLRWVPREAIAFLVYERKNEHYPEHQPTTFYDDARRLQALVPGRAIRFGDEHGHYIQMFHTTRPFRPETTDPTLEILMHSIDPGVAERFTGVGGTEGEGMAADLGIHSILPGFVTSEHVFEPAGYSLNALKDSEYYTIHVTPEDLGSYASFETNYDFGGGLNELVGAIVDLFRPRAFDVLTFLPEGEARLSVSGYSLGDHVVDALGGYRVSYFQYFVPPTGPRRPYQLTL
ncbi:MAG: adenosylmethionine decarboxylase [Deltaproteobacteria bacterium]|nr:adenosylmethionine decarboxylase [Deltaproteobacteria bacterium]